ncbi:hypothetical protein ACFSJW_21595 [Flavobacterium artemisiae]|uniref:Lipocalin-like domain-containing protein n=1 Tax=Flavobacterium artemisiae TaxID=2126556 RepID=A0ABW4HBH3_9FLAO
MKNYLLLFTLLILTSCSNNSDDAPKTSPNAISMAKNVQGKWRWIGTKNGVDGTISTPNSTNTTIILEFSGSKFKKHVDEALVMDTKFEIISQVPNGEEILSLVTMGHQKVTSKSAQILPDTSNEIIKISGNKLSLSLPCNQCNSSEYTRIQ